MNNIEKKNASIFFSSYFETLGYKNAEWEFNYNNEINTMNEYINISNLMLNQFIILGGPTNINLTHWNSSDDTILIIATYKACKAGGGINNYKKEYIKMFDLLKDGLRSPGITTLESIRKLKNNDNIECKNTMGGNGAAMRTSPIGLFFYKNINNVINESIIASKLTHNYYHGFLSGMVTALFTAYAMNNISKFKWINKLIKLYEKNILYKYHDNNNEIDEFMNYWIKYKECFIDKIKISKDKIIAGNNNSINFNERIKFLSDFYPNKKNNIFNNITKSGLDCCMYAYDCLLITDNIYSFMTLISIHPGDNDTTAAIGGAWYGALYGYSNFNIDRFKELEFYKDIIKIL
jgi:ADP-ribosylglycohydrolase